MTEKSLRTTEEDFQRFRKECEYQFARLGLQDWDITFEHKRLPKREFANYYYECEAHSGVMVYNTLKRKRDEIPEDVAKHECAHALLAPLQDLAESRFVTQREIDNVVEAIAMKLEKVL